MLSVELVGGTAPVGPEMLSSDPPRGFFALLDAFPDSYREKWGLGGYADASRWMGTRTMKGKPPPPCRTTVVRYS